MEIKVIGVIGAGQMGSGIAQVAAASGLNVALLDVQEGFLRSAVSKIEKGFGKLVEKGKMDAAAKAAALARIETSMDMKALETADFAVEAATEDEPLKLRIFAEVDRHLPAGAPLATNTSSISITKLANNTKRPDKVIGMHFMNPVPLMQLVEVIRGMHTSDETYGATVELAKRMGKTCVTSKDSPGFVVNRILMPMINEGFYALMEGIASAEEIDTAMKLGTNQPMGPLALADLIGLDTCLAIMNVLHDGLGDDKYRACPLLRKYVEAGWLGRKAGRGVYKY